MNWSRSGSKLKPRSFHRKIYPINRHSLALRKRYFFSARPISSITDDNNIPLHHLPQCFLIENDSKKFDPITHQRVDFAFNIHNGKPLNGSVDVDSDSMRGKQELRALQTKWNEMEDRYEVEWEDGTRSEFGSEWIEVQLRRRNIQTERAQKNKNVSYDDDHSITPLMNDISPVVPRLPWSNLTENDIRSKSQDKKMRFHFSDVVNEDTKLVEKAVKSLYQYGVLFVTSTPIDDNGAGVAALASALSGPAHKLSPETNLLSHYLHCKKEGKVPPSTILEGGTDGPQRTMYGNVWYTNTAAMTDGVSVADSSYGNDALPLHTDFAYSRDPPGLQIFTMVSPSDNGGESIFADGLAVAEYMRVNHEKEFDTLCRIQRRYRSIDNETGWYLEASGPVIKAIDKWEGLSEQPQNSQSKRWGAVVGIRHNDLDRLPDLPPLNSHSDYSNMENEDEKQKEFDAAFYEELSRAHQIWDNLLGSDKFRLVVKMKPGDTMVVSNHRCFHGRYSFKSTSSRSVMGCYVSQDDLESRFRWMMKGNCTFS